MGNRVIGFFRSALENVVGLIVDDGLVVVGAILALVITWALSNADAVPHVLVGIALFVLVAASLLASLLRAARDAHRHAVDAPSGDQA
jgi:uncharacterized membrane protein (Fun14 family)